VYVVDDDPGIREALASVLEDEGYVVLAAVDGRDALDQLRNGHDVPCVIFLDLMMPVMSGQQFYAEQQRDPSLAQIPVVLISADGNLRQTAQSFGSEYLAKPVKVDAVLDAAARHCSSAA
jgi:CheY-like chemotaxis protein